MGLGKATVKYLLKKAGFFVKRSSPVKPFENRLVTIFRHLEVDCLYDIGANSGQFAKMIREAGYKGMIISVEPLKDAHKVLCDNSGNDPQWKVLERMAIGDKDTVSYINVAKNSVSSSLRQVLDSHLSSEPSSRIVRKERVNVKRLDSLFQLQSKTVKFLKLDTQGNELDILKNSRKLSSLAGIQVEVSFEHLYEGDVLFNVMKDFLEKKGFVFWAMEPCFSDKRTGKVLQADAIFIKDEKANVC